MAEAALENPDLYDLTMSDEAQPLLDRVKKHVKENVDPWTEEYHALGREQAKIDRWDHHPRQVELMEAAKQKARENGLWNFFLPGSESMEGLSNLDYTYIANELGKTDCLPRP